MKFTKMHGLGNDYIYVDAARERIADPVALARAISDRHRGAGSDGLILIAPSRVADVRMEMYNADGSRGRMCGNGIRCVAKYAVERGLARGPRLRIETDAGVKLADCEIVEGIVRRVRVDMGQPGLAPSSLPATINGDRIINHPFRVADTMVSITCVSMGNPHAIIFADELSDAEVSTLGPKIEHAREFPERINVHWVRVDTRDHVTMRTWERGSGMTQACGTGACAVCVAGSIAKRTHRAVVATLPGGDLAIEWAADDHVYMTGPAEEVFTGDWPDAPDRPSAGAR